MTVPQVVAKSAHTLRAAIGRTIIATTARRVANVAMPVRRRASKTRNSVTSGPTHPGTVAVRGGLTRRAAKVFARMVTGRRGIGPMGVVLTENLAAIRNSREVRRIATATGGITGATGGTAARAGLLGPPAAIQNPGRSATLLRRTMPAAIPAHHVMAREVSTSPVTTSRVMTAAPISVRAFRARARIVPTGIVPKVIARFGSGPNSTALARIVRNSRLPLNRPTPARTIRPPNHA